MITAAQKRTRPSPSAAQIRKLMAVAAGRSPADLVITGLNLVNVHTGRVEENVSLAIHQDRIAAVGPDLDYLTGPSTEIINGRGRVAVPGMIDAHTHLDAVSTVRAFARLALAGGNTAVATEMGMIAGAAGLSGIKAFMEEASGIPFRTFFLVPPHVPPMPEFETSAGLDLKSFQQVLKHPLCLGVGETYWRAALNLDKDLLKRFAAARKLGKTLEGHAAGARGSNLTAYVAGGISSCHESISADEALERLSLGLAVQIRDGEVRSEIPAMGPLAEQKDLDLRRLMLVTDQSSPEMTTETGIMKALIQKAVAVGFDPVAAVKLVTINPADHFGLTDLGRLSPGALADVVLLDSLEYLNTDLVLVGGQVVYSLGLLTVNFPDYQYPAEFRESIRLKHVKAADFALPAPNGPVRVRAVSVLNETITKEEIVETMAVRGRVPTDTDQGLNKIAVFNRGEEKPSGAVGLARGLGLRSGALATSMIWDTTNILCAGASDKEMALAVNRLIENRGGLVVAKGEKILAEMPLPVAGIISEKPYPQLMEEAEDVAKAIKKLGSPLTRPFLTLQTFCFTGLPFLRLTDKGLVDVRKNRFVDVVV